MKRDNWTGDKIVLAANMAFSRPWFSMYINGRQGVPPWVRLKLEQILRVEPNSLGSQRGVVRRFFGRQSPLEVKDLIVDQATSNQVLGATPPTFKTCVEHSCTIHVASQEKKRQPEFLPGLNHFFQPAAILRIQSVGVKGTKLLAYERKPSPPKLQFEMSKGDAVLWAASYCFNEDRAHHPMDFWMEKVAERDPKAATMFTNGEGCIMLQLLQYKLRLEDFRTVNFEPLGVASIDLRDTPRKAIYTQYVFVGSIIFTNLPLQLEDLSRLGVPLKLLDEKRDTPEEVCVDEKGRPHSLDVVAWRGLISREQTIRHENATFHRGFELF